ncbi:hypothetical protein [Paraflavitalea sp. CAU 1676]|uniref:hypothetical protein n=1 Tax=Paraflavitalea sp. CAU 1676 TaxID=3032598 RepID=UPI0023DB0D57|nr:hypothetical protein [Paraflavitalea sp. CAU 1676]MDF2186994.1 hypothetical protein [Paraflavitalea sp. CAU 1676]
MATSLQYAFNQEALLELFKRPGAETVNFWLVNLVKHPHTNPYMYIYAQVHDADGNAILSQNIAGAKGEQACPVPPGWQCDLTPPSISQQQLELAPRFAIELAKLKPLIEENEFLLEARVAVNPEKHAVINQVLINLEGKLTDEGLEPVLTLTSLKKNGILKSALEIESFKTPVPSKNGSRTTEITQ